MTETYLFRAKLEFEWAEGFKRSPQPLPVRFGPFKLDESPNYELYLEERGYEFGAKEGKQPKWEYPVSLLYVESEIIVKAGEYPEYAADQTFEQLEGMLRLFQEGHIYLRRHPHLWHLEEGVPKPEFFFVPQPIKPEPATLYERRPYRLDDETLGEFVDFFNSYWDVLRRESGRLRNALHRFSASCEARTLADRLTELVIALDALFGDGADSLAYKIALRCASLLYPPGEARERAFKTIKKVYGERSELLHGAKLDTKFPPEEICQLEGDVRRAIVKFFNEHKAGRPINKVEELDRLLFFEEKGLWPPEGKS